MRQLATSTKLLYGFGFSARGIKDGLFQMFLFFYFNQVLGLDPALAGLTTLISLVFDAVSDPVVGMISDDWKSKKWGRRHPFMLASAIPFGLFTFLLFMPPSGLSQMALFWWLTIFTILVRLALTLFIVPGMSLGAELTTDYEERTSVTSYRVMFSAIVPAAVLIFGLLVFFKPTEGYEDGMMNPAAYPRFAALCGILIVLIILISTIGTRNVIPNLPKNVTTERAKLSQIIGKFKAAMKLKSYRSLVAYIMVVYVAIGIGTVLIPYFVKFFFAWSEKELALLPITSGIGGFLSLIIGPFMGKKFDKKKASIISTVLLAFFFSLPYTLRLFDMLPENGAPSLLPIFLLCTSLGYIFIFVILSLANSMMADVVDEYELISKKREEGLFFSTMSFAYKCTVGLGYLAAGILLKVIEFPNQVTLADIPADKIEWLGIIGGPVLFIIYVSSVVFLLAYPINKVRYNDIREQLENNK